MSEVYFQKALPFVSVVIPALNCADDVQGFAEAILRQDYPAERFEVIVVDNGSSDDTFERARAAGFFTLLCEERGRTRALNMGLKAAKGEIVCTSDMSCRAVDHWISTVVESFADQEVACVAGEIKLLKGGDDSPVIAFQERANYMSPMHAIRRNRLPFLPFADGANASFRRKIFEEIGGFEESFIKGGDVEICYRLLTLTDYKLVFDFRALMWEPGEPNLGALLKQRFRMGIGWNLMRMKYPLIYEQRDQRSIKVAYWSFRAALKNTRELLVDNIQALFGRHREAAYDANIRFLMKLTQSYGRIYGRWYLRRLGIAPTPMNLVAQQRLIERTAVDRVIVREKDVG